MSLRVEHGEVQAGVLRGHGRNVRSATFEFLRITSPEEAREPVARLLAEVHFGSRPDAARRGTPPHINVAFTYRGLETLLSPPASPRGHEELLAAFPKDFRQGARARAALLGDVWHGRDEARLHEAHLLVAVHGGDRGQRRERIHALLGGSGWHSRVHLREAAWPSGRMLREPFGFADGRSQPAVEGVDADAVGDGLYTTFPAARAELRQRLGLLAEDLGLRNRPRRWRLIRTGEFVLGYPDEDGVLPQGPPAPLGPDGTFMVYREIDQDVAGFERYVQTWAERAGLTEEELKAKIVGRWPDDGAPAADHPDHLPPNRRRLNDFRYDGDREGFGCPLGAHVRRANPRDGLPGGAEQTARRRIIRRGLPYEDGGTEGLAFICYGASIERGFEFVQREWINRGTKLGIGPDADFLLQQEGPNGEPPSARLVIQGHRPTVLEPPPKPFATVRDCEYLFVPSRRACEWLAGQLSSPRPRPKERNGAR